MHTLGRHLLIELYGCPASRLDALDAVREALAAAVAAVGASPVGECFHRFAPQGVSGTVLIAESHLSLHSWPEHGYAAIDVFTCGGLDPRPAIDAFARVLGAREVRAVEMIRGVPAHLPAGAHLRPEDVVARTITLAG